jgi:serine protease inhibitor
MFQDLDFGGEGMQRAAVLFLVCLMALPVVAGCTNTRNASIVEVEAPVYQLADFSYQPDTGSYSFDFNLFRQAVKEGGATNLVLSPLSAKIALAMAYNGATGETREQMARVLGFEGMSLEEVNRRMSQLMDELENAGRGVQVDIANSMWANSPIEKDFAARVSEWYGAQAQSVEAWDATTIERMNAWVSDNTGGRITRMVNDVDPITILILLNALYFKAQWARGFDPALTEDADFHLPDGTAAQVSMMHQSGEYEYYENEDLQMVALPYKGGRMDMCIILPREGKDLSSMLESLDSAKWGQLTGRLTEGEGNIALPGFKVAYEKELSDTLKALGMKQAFVDGLQGIAQVRGPVFIGKVLQKTWMEVNEEGTEAAAATEVDILARAVPEPPFTMTVDCPFIFVIRDNRTGAPLFLGTIVSP